MAFENEPLTTEKIILAIFYILMCPILLLLLSGDWLWIEGWLFGIWFIILSLWSLVYLYRHDPALLQERFKKPGAADQKEWDKYWLYVFAIVLIIWFVIMPLDVKRFEWTTNFPFVFKIFGGLALIISYFFLYRAITDNPFASALVRIQRERGQHVVSTGVYGFVRHPMYLGALLLFIGTPLLLGSKYGLIIGAIISFLLVVRIIGEEKMLVEELAGYEDYQKKVKYRLIPFVW